MKESMASTAAARTNIKIMNKLLIASISLLAVVGIYFGFVREANAQSAAELAAEISNLQSQIDQNQTHANELHEQAETLREKITQLQEEVDITQKRIDLTDLKIKKLNKDIEVTEEELDYQKGILAESIRELYKRGDITTIELLASSDSYSDFINQQEYLSRIKSAIQESAAKIEKLKDELEAERRQQQNLREELDGQRQILNNQKAEQQQLLSETEGQEARYQTILANLKDQQAEAEAALAAFIAAGKFVNLGPISQGNAIGTVGNTGFSTGPHLHMEVRDSNGNVTDPKPFINSGWSWPTVNSVWQIWQDYGVPSGWYVRGYHPGIDTGYAGETVVAMASGTIIARGCSIDFLGTPAYGYMVMIDHNNGYKSLYAHMLPPAGGAYSHCSSSYGF